MVSPEEDDDDEDAVAADSPQLFNLLQAFTQMMPDIFQLLHHKHKRRTCKQRAQLQNSLAAPFGLHMCLFCLFLLIHEFFRSSC